MSYSDRALALLGLVLACGLALAIGGLVAFKLEDWIARRVRRPRP